MIHRNVGMGEETLFRKILRCSIVLISMAVVVFGLVLCTQPVGKLVMAPVKYYIAKTAANEYGGQDIFVRVDKIRSCDVYADMTNNSDAAIYICGTEVQKKVKGKWVSIRTTASTPANGPSGDVLRAIAPGEILNICADSAESLGFFALGKFRIVVNFELEDTLFCVYDEF